MAVVVVVAVDVDCRMLYDYLPLQVVRVLRFGARCKAQQSQFMMPAREKWLASFQVMRTLLRNVYFSVYVSILCDIFIHD
jgi:hypothetical protein